MARVKNINGTSQYACSCGSWLKHWEKISKEKSNYCSEATCINKASVGSHVQKVSVYDSSWYIVPLCDSHNKSSGNLDIRNTTLISASKSKTCG